MAKADTKIIYDKNEDILYLSRGRKAKASIEIGDFVIDIDFKGFVSAIEILNASENLGVKPDVLKKIKEAFMYVVYKPNFLVISLHFLFEKEKPEKIIIPLTLSLGHKKVIKKEVCFA